MINEKSNSFLPISQNALSSVQQVFLERYKMEVFLYIPLLNHFCSKQAPFGFPQNDGLCLAYKR